jgi:hypothetical protein
MALTGTSEISFLHAELLWKQLKEESCAEEISVFASA